eukprot:490466-Rhodomonas_salina.2
MHKGGAFSLALRKTKKDQDPSWLRKGRRWFLACSSTRPRRRTGTLNVNSVNERIVDMLLGVVVESACDL